MKFCEVDGCPHGVEIPTRTPILYTANKDLEVDSVRCRVVAFAGHRMYACEYCARDLNFILAEAECWLMLEVVP